MNIDQLFQCLVPSDNRNVVHRAALMVGLPVEPVPELGGYEAIKLFTHENVHTIPRLSLAQALNPLIAMLTDPSTTVSRAFHIHAD